MNIFQERIIINEHELYQECTICFERYDVKYHESGMIYSKTPILINCGHTFCY